MLKEWSKKNSNRCFLKQNRLMLAVTMPKDTATVKKKTSSSSQRALHHSHVLQQLAHKQAPVTHPQMSCPIVFLSHPHACFIPTQSKTAEHA